MNSGSSSVCMILFCRQTDLTVVPQLSLFASSKRCLCFAAFRFRGCQWDGNRRHTARWPVSREHAVLNMSKRTFLFVAFCFHVSWYLHHNVTFGRLRSCTDWEARRAISEDKWQSFFTGHWLFGWLNSCKTSCAVSYTARKVICLHDS